MASVLFGANTVVRLKIVGKGRDMWGSKVSTTCTDEAGKTDVTLRLHLLVVCAQANRFGRMFGHVEKA